MENYKQMYLHLFNEVSKATEILINAQKACEEMYLSLADNEKEDLPSIIPFKSE